MFFHSMKYTLLAMIRDKSSMFWCFAFPLILGTMFHFAFGALGKSESFFAIPVAVAGDDTASVHEIFDPLCEGGDAFLEVTYTSETEALTLLEQKEIYGIFSVDLSGFSGSAASSDRAAPPPLALTISAEMNSDPLYQSILSSFTEQFNISYNAITETAITHPEKRSEVLETLAAETNYISDVPLGDGSTDESLNYFFNLIAMVCLFSAMSGNVITINNQANLSALGARKCISPVHKLISILGDLSAGLLFNFMTVLTTLLYLMAVLNVNFGTQFGFITLASLCGCLTGISLGFFVGSIGHFSEQTKFGILMSVIMAGCMLSGLMLGNMRTVVENFCPLLNRINPSALISDALYSLAVYPSHERFFSNIAGLLTISALFVFGGFLLVRRKKYASL